MRLMLYRLQFKAPLHIGLEGIGAEKIDLTVHSDTLWGALANAYLALGLPFDFEQPQFFVSSAFPYFGEHLFFPLPMGALDYLFEEAEEHYLKAIKKIEFVEKSLFEKLIGGQKPSWQSLYFYKRNKAYLLGKACDELNETMIFQVQETPRVTLDRYTDSAVEGQIFYFAQMVFAPQAGLFFLARFNGEDEQNRFEAALRFLGDEGLGADRTVGKGLFDFDARKLELETPQTADMFTTLALYHPHKDEIKNGLLRNARYGLITRKGFAFNPAVRGKRRKFVRMFTEGSVFTRVTENGQSPGDVPTVIPAQGDFIPFSVKRYGIAFDVPVVI
jgi:CRISPR-associated protein Csm4